MTIREKAALAERAARASGEMLEHHGAFKVKRKSENDFVTEMDVKSEMLLKEMLLGACPEDEFYGEETGGATRAVGRWIVDPIDGTSNFMRGHRLYTISIAYEHDGVLQIGCVYCPDTDELFLAIRGEGATLNGHPIHVAQTPLRDAIVDLGFGHRIPENRERTMKVFPGLLSAISDVRAMNGVFESPADAGDMLALKGRTVVAFETVEHEGRTVAIHADIADVALKYDIVVVSDEPYEAIMYDGRKMYMSVDDRCGPPYTIVFDDDYEKLCPWAKVMKSGRVWPDELTDAVVEVLESEKDNRAQRREKRKMRNNGSI